MRVSPRPPTPLKGDGSLKAFLLGLKMANHGFVYVLGNKAMPGIYKIGMTDRSPSSRCDELSSATAIPYPFNVLAFVPTDDALVLEQGLHEHFDRARCSPRREFFSLDFSNIISDIGDMFASPFVTADGCEVIINDASRRKTNGIPATASFHAARMYCRPQDFDEGVDIMTGVRGIDVSSFLEESKRIYMTAPDEREPGEEE